jgi:hypothetical protein
MTDPNELENAIKTKMARANLKSVNSFKKV